MNTIFKHNDKSVCTTDKKIKVIDSLMGSGKTSYVIDMMNKADVCTKFIYVTPYLKEVERIQKSVKNRSFRTPDAKQGMGTKYDSLKHLIGQGMDIVTTHALFSRADDELLDLLKWENYVLVIDEVMDVINQVQLKKNDIDVLLNSGLIELSNNQVNWKADSKLDSKYNDIRDLALSGNLYYVDKFAFVWNFPAKVFKAFEEVYLLTYLFAGQTQRYYYDLHGVEYEYYGIEKGTDGYVLVERSLYKEDRQFLKQLISIYEGSLNDIGSKDTSLSKGWFISSRNQQKVRQLKNNVYNYFRNIASASSNEIMWTTFKDYESKIKGKGYSKGFTAFNLRATNEFVDKNALAFCLNRFMNPIETTFFRQHNVVMDEELLALSDLLQWLFRSAIREGNPVQVYIPSKRMRDLLIKWLNNEI